MAKMSLSIYMKGDYDEFYALRRRKNKANSKPISESYPPPKGTGRGKGT